MNRKFLYLGLAATAMLTGCSSDDDFTAGNEPVGNSDTPIMLTMSQDGNKTRAELGNKDEQGNYDGTFDADNLGIYCLATGKIDAQEDINWTTGIDNPNILWLENIRAKAVTNTVDGTKVTDLQWYDNTKRYYPMGSQYRYTFYGYHPYGTPDKNGTTYSIDINNLDGTKDVIWAKTGTPTGNQFADYAYSALFFRENKNALGTAYNVRDFLPKLVFKHKLMKFNIIIKKGTGDDLDKVGVKNVTLHNVSNKGTLVIASQDGTNEGKFTPDWTSTTTLTLKNTNGTPLSGADYFGDNDQRTIGGGFLLPALKKQPNGTYPDNGYTEGGMANKGVFRLRVDFNRRGDTYDTTYKAAQYEIVPPAEGWKEGYEYDIIITVSSPLEIASTAYLTPWEKGEITLR